VDSPVTVLRGSGTLTPDAARRTLVTNVDVPTGTRALLLRLTFAPSRVNNIRNLVTLAVFEPDGAARGSAHRHEPTQVVEIGETFATPGFVAGHIPLGRWAVALDVHCVMPSDVGGVRYTLEVEAAQVPWTGGPSYAVEARGFGHAVAVRDEPRWLKGDLHVHSDHSDGRWGIDAIVAYARTASLDFIALTDHNTHTGTQPLREALWAAGLATVVIPGLELTTYGGHANALGIEGWTDWRTLPPGATAVELADGDPEVRVADAGLVRPAEGELPVPFQVHQPVSTMEATARAIQGRGGLFVVNHPRSAGYPACTGCHWDFDDAPAYADAIEVMNGEWARRQNDDGLALWDRWLAAGWRVPATAGSDAHVAPALLERVGYTYAWASPEVASIIRAVRAGQTFLSRGPHVSWDAPIAGTEVSRILPEVSVRLAGVTAGCQVHLWRDGRLVEFRPVPEGDSIQAFPLKSRPVAGTWFRVHVVHQPKVGTPELLAMTNPVWVGR
jgi:hypothetical protein